MSNRCKVNGPIGRKAAADTTHAFTAGVARKNRGRPKDLISILTKKGGLTLTHEMFDNNGRRVAIPRKILERMYACDLLAAAADYELSDNETLWASNDAKTAAGEEKVPSENFRREVRLFLTGVINHEVGLIDLLDHNANMISGRTLAQLGLMPRDATEEGS